MPDLTGLQFSSWQRGGRIFEGIARNPEGRTVASANITVPEEFVAKRYEPPGGELAPHFPQSEGGYKDYGHMVPDFRPPDVGEQARMPIVDNPSKVSWALGNQEGIAKAAPHQLIAAMSRRHGVTPTADDSLSPEGSRMSRSAARRGLVKPHPMNPKMEATIPPIFEGETEVQTHLNWTRGNYNYSAAHAHEYGAAEMAAARGRVFPPRQKQVPHHVSHEQISLL